jgi:hypothetical protein
VLAQIRNLLTVGATAAIAAIVIAAPAQAFNISFRFSFLDADEDPSNDPALLGFFVAEDANSNARLDFEEITAFAAAFTDLGESVSWGLADLSPDSFYVSPDDYFLAAISGLNSFRSNSLFAAGGSVAASTEVEAGFTYFDASPLTFHPPVAVPEPATMVGLALAGAGLTAARRRKQA